MNRAQIVDRINQKMYEGLYEYDDIKYDLDDAIIAINNIMHTKYPSMTEILVESTSEYAIDSKPIFPFKYINSVVIEFVVASLFRREGEFGHEFNVAQVAFERNMGAMFRDLYEKVPEEFIDEMTGVIPINPYEVENYE